MGQLPKFNRDIEDLRLECKSIIKDFFWKINFPKMRALKFLTGHVTFKICYNQIYQLKTTLVSFDCYTWIYNQCYSILIMMQLAVCTLHWCPGLKFTDQMTFDTEQNVIHKIIVFSKMVAIYKKIDLCELFVFRCIFV